MEKKLKLSQKLSFRGWPQDCVSELLKLETDNEELQNEVKELKNELGRRTGKNTFTAKEDSGPPRNVAQPLIKSAGGKPKA
jgi:hypothetical protein